ncbi:hypothetical protein EW145_g1788 [Phellinidium pouzarii]|uniref:Polysaccharide lyase 14 domain-containing protein n=1 Tax=Phellinidium pouzarii TaxID=167371 RepID=A0A4S4LDG5_9AGAM|nr:hypothetical protein EW145_g1788 [Phellinidium pouzarii]
MRRTLFNPGSFAVQNHDFRDKGCPVISVATQKNKRKRLRIVIPSNESPRIPASFHFYASTIPRQATASSMAAISDLAMKLNTSPITSFTNRGEITRALGVRDVPLQPVTSSRTEYEMRARNITRVGVLRVDSEKLDRQWRSHLRIQPASIGSFVMDNWLFPDTHNYTSAWTTSSVVDIPFVQHVDLSDEALGVHGISLRPDVVPAPNVSSSGIQKSWRAFYPKGSTNPKGNIPGGFGFYMGGPSFFKDKLAGAKEVLFGYSVLFQDDWEGVKGGKLPGAFGGVGTDAYACTGGRKEGRELCFNLRLMWRERGAGELYAYLPFSDENRSRLLGIPPKSILNSDYGFSVGRGAFTFSPGVWTTITERIKLNDVDRTDGEVEIQINGQTVILATGLTIRTTTKAFTQGMHLQTFFGGHGAVWASPKDQYAWFTDVSGAIII